MEDYTFYKWMIDTSKAELSSFKTDHSLLSTTLLRLINQKYAFHPCLDEDWSISVKKDVLLRTMVNLQDRMHELESQIRACEDMLQRIYDIDSFEEYGEKLRY